MGPWYNIENFAGTDSTGIVEDIQETVSNGYVTIDSFSRFNNIMYSYMKTAMIANNVAKEGILDRISGYENQSSGNSGSITEPWQTEYNPFADKYTTAMDYIRSMESAGAFTTRISFPSEGAPFTNLYPNQNNSDEPEMEETSWFVDTTEPKFDKNSLLYKTKRLFDLNKINTIIEKFGTHTDENADGEMTRKTELGDVTDPKNNYGMSKGRNLLTKEAEVNGGKYPTMGYNNPYCRVWTYFHKMSKLKDMMRPFKDGDKFRSIKEVHKWGEYEWATGDSEESGKNDSKGKYMWKDGQSARWEKSVLSGRGDGLINITPKYNAGSPIHTKDCMFSIENLAWKDYNPYSFETALSWEQRGPNGGRIMWFPPYGLSFNENTNATWNTNTFIGRGEDVYTYVNTKRSGTLSFYLLVDHPSVTDYATWYRDGGQGNYGTLGLSDNDIHRYFAGCDTANANEEESDSLNSYTSPTPMTNEGNAPPVTSKPPEKDPEKEEETDEDVNHTKEETVEFCVFFPNNYSGMFDCESDENGGVEFAINYLLAGRNAQEGFILQGNERKPVRTIIPIDFENPRGYEIDKTEGITDPLFQGQVSEQTIIGNKYMWSSSNSKYEADEDKLWYYRIDGTYDLPSGNGESGNTQYTNTYDQKLRYTENYKDNKSFQLNSSLENQKKIYGSNIPETAYTFAEFADAFTQWWSTDFARVIDMFKNNPSINNNNGRTGYLTSLFQEATLTKIECVGYSNSHGSNQIKTKNDKRNYALAEGRAKTIVNWLKLNRDWVDVETTIDVKPSENIGTDTDASSLTAKLYRMAKCVLTFQVDETEDLTDSSDEYEDNPEMQEPQQTGEEYVDTVLVSEVSVDNGTARDSESNNIRYDQEYYFFKKFQEEHPVAYETLMHKLQYFNPAFHSMTPEGFNARLTFLNQCTRAGNTISVSDQYRKSASNMAFGRPPFCVLRVGDFYNQMIVIKSINISYDESEGLMWDLNDEGVGVQPMLAKVTLEFDFIGGGSLGGAIRRLQNAMTFNYYANTELYDNRADKIEYNIDKDLKVGGGGLGTINKSASHFRNVDFEK